MVQLSWAITQKSLPLGVWDSAQRRKDLHVQSEETTKCRKAIIFQLKNKFKKCTVIEGPSHGHSLGNWWEWIGLDFMADKTL